MKRPKRLLVLVCALIVLASIVTYVLANSFYFNFIATPYNPSRYTWTNPWTVSQAVDFVAATLNITGSGFQNDLQTYILAFQNTATDIQNYILSGFTYNVTFTVGAQTQVITSGTYAGTPLLITNTTTSNGTFTPTMYGAGNVNMSITGITWIQSQPITWSTNVLDPNTLTPTWVLVQNFTISGATRGYTSPGTVNIKFDPTKGGYVRFNVTLPTLGTQSFVFQQLLQNFTYAFPAIPVSGAQTCTLTIVSQGSS